MSTARTKITCEEADRLMDDWFGADGEPSGTAAAHLQDCARCRELYDWMFAETDQEPLGIEEKLCERISAGMKAVKPLPSTGVLVGRFLAVFSAMVIVMVALLGAIRPGAMSLPQLLAVAAVLGAGAIFLSLSLSWQMVPGKHQRIPAPLLIGAFAAGFVVVVGALFPWESASEMLGMGWGCTRAGLEMAVPTAALLIFLVTRGAPLSFGVLGGSLGATSGLLALTVLQFHCNNQHAGHLLLWHGGVVVLCTVAGYLLGLLATALAARRS